jgi:hypothetical protein
MQLRVVLPLLLAVCTAATPHIHFFNRANEETLYLDTIKSAVAADIDMFGSATLQTVWSYCNMMLDDEFEIAAFNEALANAVVSGAIIETEERTYELPVEEASEGNAKGKKTHGTNKPKGKSEGVAEESAEEVEEEVEEEIKEETDELNEEQAELLVEELDESALISADLRLSDQKERNAPNQPAAKVAMYACISALCAGIMLVLAIKRAVRHRQELSAASVPSLPATQTNFGESYTVSSLEHKTPQQHVSRLL